jgi:glycosyltransferase involved in cell wall biosynthesis
VSIVSPAAFGGASRAHRLGIPTAVTFHSVVPQTRLLASGLDLFIRSSRWPVVFSAVSARVARDVQPLAGARTIRLIPNGIEQSFWRALNRQPETGRRRTFEIASVMRLNSKKRPLALIDMMRRLIVRLPVDGSARLRIAGDGPLRTRVERAIARFGLAQHVQLLGVQSRHALRELFAQSDIFVLPTVRESFGLAALEARCAGLPVVAMAASGVAELIEHGREGLLAHSDAELLLHVLSLATDADRRERIADHNRATLPGCDWETVLDEHLDLYSEAMALRASSMRRT